MDTELTNEPICPHCGHRERDAWEINFGPGMEGDTTVTCGSCGEDYFCSRQVDVSYTTSKLPANASLEGRGAGLPAERPSRSDCSTADGD